MVMTIEQQYAALLQELGEVLQHKNTTISTQKWQIERLKERLKDADIECEEATAHAMKLDEQLLEAKCEIERLNEQIKKLKGGAA